ncbi:transposase [Actinomyces johnsonii]|uniref:transposase n=1 Tax=Actinomyces johnsonii TaxID=544581 RepID=UPI0028D44DFD|nr:transposase [Actinomyces johnsonii]
MAFYAPLTPLTRRSGSSIRGEPISPGDNKRLKRAMFSSAFASPRSDTVSQAYYQRKRDQGKPPWARPSSPRPTTAS